LSSLPLSSSFCLIPAAARILLAIALFERSYIEAAVVDKPEAPDRFAIAIECIAP
jgi:hypothetical protein